MKLRLRQLGNTGKEFLISSFELLSKGVSFETLASSCLENLKGFLPHNLQFPVTCLAVYLLFHMYIAYVLAFTATKFLLSQTKIKGAKLYPVFPGAKQKLTVWVTSLFIFHWISSNSLFGLLNWQFLADWVFTFRPQINIKPQLKVVQRTSSCHSSHSNMSFSMEEPDASWLVGLEPGDKDTQNLLKNVEGARRSISTASDIFHSLTSNASRSRESLSSLSSLGSIEDVDEDVKETSEEPPKKQAVEGKQNVFLRMADQIMRMSTKETPQLRRRVLEESLHGEDEA